MVNLSRKSILERFPWAKEKSLFDEIDSQKDINDSMQWNLSEEQLQLVVLLFTELEEWFEKRNMEIDIDIYYVGELMDSLKIDFSSNTREVFLIIEKYKQFSLDLLEEEDEEDNYENIF